jgi:hypothetical protein
MHVVMCFLTSLWTMIRGDFVARNFETMLQNLFSYFDVIVVLAILSYVLNYNIAGIILHGMHEFLAVFLNTRV